MKYDNVTSFEKAAQFRKLLESLRKAGWQPTPGATLDGAPEAGPMIYVCDVENGTLYMAVLPKDAIERTKADATITGLRLTPAEIEGHASALFAHVATREITLTDEDLQYAAAVMSIYLAQTNAYSMVNKADINSAHFIVVRYRCAKTGTYWNRTVGALASHQLGPRDIERVANQVLSTDRKRRPDRFAQATVLQFRVRPAG